MTPNTDRYKRINLDGKSINYTTTSAVDLKGGQIVCLATNGLAVLATAAMVLAGAKLYAVISQTLGLSEVIKAGDSLTLDYMQQGREFALLVTAGSVLTRDLVLTVDTGVLKLVAASAPVKAYSVETYTVAAGKQELVRVRIA